MTDCGNREPNACACDAVRGANDVASRGARTQSKTAPTVEAEASPAVSLIKRLHHTDLRAGAHHRDGNGIDRRGSVDRANQRAWERRGGARFAQRTEWTRLLRIGSDAAVVHSGPWPGGHCADRIRMRAAQVGGPSSVHTGTAEPAEQSDRDGRAVAVTRLHESPVATGGTDRVR